MDVKIDVIPDELQKYIAFITNKNLVFIDIMQFINSSLEKLAVKKSSKKTTTIFSRQWFQIFNWRIWFKKKNVMLLKQKYSYKYG